jgi:hypothetical protein
MLGKIAVASAANRPSVINHLPLITLNHVVKAEKTSVVTVFPLA